MNDAPVAASPDTRPVREPRPARDAGPTRDFGPTPVSLDEVKKAIKRPAARDDHKVIHVAPPAPPAEDKPLEVAKVAVTTDDAPVIVTKRKKMEVKKQADTDGTDEPLKVVKLAVTAEAAEAPPLPAKAKPKRKGLLGSLLG